MISWMKLHKSVSARNSVLWSANTSHMAIECHMYWRALPSKRHAQQQCPSLKWKPLCVCKQWCPPWVWKQMEYQYLRRSNWHRQSRGQPETCLQETAASNLTWQHTQTIPNIYHIQHKKLRPKQCPQALSKSLPFRHGGNNCCAMEALTMWWQTSRQTQKITVKTFVFAVDSAMQSPQPSLTIAHSLYHHRLQALLELLDFSGIWRRPSDFQYYFGQLANFPKVEPSSNFPQLQSLQTQMKWHRPIRAQACKRQAPHPIPKEHRRHQRLHNPHLQSQRTSCCWIQSWSLPRFLHHVNDVTLAILDFDSSARLVVAFSRIRFLGTWWRTLRILDSVLVAAFSRLRFPTNFSTTCLRDWIGTTSLLCLNDDLSVDPNTASNVSACPHMTAQCNCYAHALAWYSKHNNNKNMEEAKKGNMELQQTHMQRERESEEREKLLQLTPPRYIKIQKHERDREGEKRIRIHTHTTGKCHPTTHKSQQK